MVNNKINDDEQMHLRCGPFQRPCRCTGAIQTALPDAACPGLLRKPLDAGIGQLLATYRPSGRQGNRQTNNNQQMTLKRWPNRWPWQCASTLPRTLPDGGGLGLSKMPLNATIGWVLRPIMTIGHTSAGFFYVFIVKTIEKGRRLTLRPLFLIGVLHIKQKKRAYLRWVYNLLGGSNYKNNIWTRGFAIAFVFAIAVFKTQNWSPEKTLNFVTFSEFLTHPRVHHTVPLKVHFATVQPPTAITARTKYIHASNMMWRA
jgi:hypothetical protein